MDSSTASKSSNAEKSPPVWIEVSPSAPLRRGSAICVSWYVSDSSSHSLIRVFNRTPSISQIWNQEQYDTHDPKGYCLVALPFLMKRTRVIEIVAARDIVFALAHSGVCAAFSRGFFCFLLFFSCVI